MGAIVANPTITAKLAFTEKRMATRQRAGNPVVGFAGPNPGPHQYHDHDHDGPAAADAPAAAAGEAAHAGDGEAQGPAAAAPAYLTPEDIFKTTRTHKRLPAATVPAFAALAGPVFSAYKHASTNGNWDDATRLTGVILSLIRQGLAMENAVGNRKRNHGQLRRKMKHLGELYAKALDKPGSRPDLLSHAAADALLKAATRETERAEARALRPPPPDAAEKAAVRKVLRIETMVREGHIGRAARAATSTNGAVRVDPAMADTLRAMHPAPPADRETPALPDDAPTHNFDLGTLTKATKKACNGSANGASGWTPEIILQLLPHHDCAEGLIALANDIANDRGGPLFRALLLQCRGVALKKPDSTKPRPVAIGEVFFRISAYCTLGPMRGPLGAHFEPLQAAVGAPGGSERVLHILQAATESMGPESAALLLDLENAFNLADRSEALRALYAVPSLAPLWRIMSFAYGHEPTNVVYITIEGTMLYIHSADGSRQGCPLGSITFCAYAQKHFLAAVAGFDTEVVAQAVADDFGIVGSIDNILVSLQRLKDGPMTVNLGKTKILWPHEAEPPQRLVDACVEHGVKLVLGGTPHLGGWLGLSERGGVDLQGEHLLVQVETHAKLLEVVSHPKMHRQAAQLLLRMCAATKLGYLARVTPTHIAKEPFERFDEQLLATYTAKLLTIERRHAPGNVDPQGQQDQAATPNTHTTHQLETSLSMRVGGGGVSLASAISSPAFYAATVAAASSLSALGLGPRPGEPLRQFERARNAAHQNLVAAGVQTSDDDKLTLEGRNTAWLPDKPADTTSFYAEAVSAPLALKLQRHLTHELQDIRYELHFQTLSKVDQIRLLTGSAPSSSAWLRTVPRFDNPDLCLPNVHALHAHRQRVGLGPAPQAVTCGFCKKSVADDPHHAHHCVTMRRGATTRRHDMLNDLFARQCLRAGVPCIKEITANPYAHGDVPQGPRKRPDANQHWGQGNDTFTDTTVVSPIAPSIVAKSSINVCVSQLKYRAKAKVKKYSEISKATGSPLIPLAIGIFGRLCKEFAVTLKRVAVAALHSELIEEAELAPYKQRLVQETSIVLQKGNSIMGLCYARRAVRGAPTA